MDERLIRWVMIRAAVLGAVLCAGSLSYGRLDVSLSLALGAGLGVGNLWALTRIVRRLFERSSAADSAGAGGQVGAGAVLVLKFVAFAALLFVILRSFPVHLLALVVGLSAVVVAIVLGSVLGPAPSQDTQQPPPPGAARGMEEDHGA